VENGAFETVEGRRVVMDFGYLEVREREEGAEKTAKDLEERDFRVYWGQLAQ
jgi:hypothetical protein